MNLIRIGSFIHRVQWRH